MVDSEPSVYHTTWWMKARLNLKVDGYSAARGGDSRAIFLHCRRCRALAMIYQKDGDGDLYRCYNDRVIESTLRCAPRTLSRQQQSWECSSCDEPIGVAMVYETGKGATQFVCLPGRLRQFQPFKTT